MLGFHSNTAVEEEKCRPMDEFSFSILYCAIFIYLLFATYISYMCLKSNSTTKNVFFRGPDCKDPNRNILKPKCP